MNELAALEALGLTLPSPWAIAGAVLFGLIGLVAWRRGRKNKQSVLFWLGLALMFYPYAVSETGLLWGVGGALTGLVVWKWGAA